MVEIVLNAGMILVDTSAWIQFFRVGQKTVLDLLNQKKAAASDVVLLELIPYIHLQKNEPNKVIRSVQLLEQVDHIFDTMSESDWEHLMKCQSSLLKRGVNGVTIPDLMIAYRCQRLNIPLFTLDKLLKKAAGFLGVVVYQA